MKDDELSVEIEKLKARRIELASAVNIARDQDEKEDLKMQIERLQTQIETLEKFFKRR